MSNTNIPNTPTFPEPIEWKTIFPLKIETKYFSHAKVYSDDMNVSICADNTINGIKKNTTTKDEITYETNIFVRVFLSRDGALIRNIASQEQQEIKVADNELLVFLEDNTGDSLTNTSAFLVAGNGAKKELGLGDVSGNLINDLELSGEEFETLIRAAQTSNGLFLIRLEQIVLKNIVDLSTGKKGKRFKWFRQLLNVQNVIANLLEKVLTGLNNFLQKTVRAKASFWNPKEKGYKSNVAALIEWLSGEIPEKAKAFREYEQYIDGLLSSISGSDASLTLLARKVLQTAKGLIGFFAQLLEGFAAVLNIKKDEIVGDVQFFVALVTGFFNGLIDLITGIIGLLILILKGGKAARKLAAEISANPKETLELLLEYLDNMLQALADISFDGVWSAIKNGASKIWTAIQAATKEASPAQVGYFTGYLVFNIIEIFVPIFKIAKANNLFKLAKPDKLFRASDNLKAAIAKATGAAQDAKNVTFKAIAEFVDFLRRSGKNLKEFVEQIFVVLRKWLDELGAAVKTELLVYQLRRSGPRNAYALEPISALILGTTQAIRDVLGFALTKVFLSKTQKITALGIAKGDKVYYITYEQIAIKEFKTKADLRVYLRNVFNKNKTDDILREFLEGELLKKLNLRLKKNKVNVDIINSDNVVVFRGVPKDVKKYLNFITKTVDERKALIQQMLKKLENNSNRYNPANAKAKGYDIPASKNGKGTAPDFSNLKKYLYDNSLDYGNVRIKVTGSRTKDFEQAFEKMGITKEQAKKYTWNHLDDIDENLEATLQFVLKDVHRKTYKHIGSPKQYQELLNIDKYLS